MNLKYMYILCAIFFSVTTTYSNVCSDGAILWEATFSLNDNTFSQEYDGTSGIIERIYRNESIDKYSIWQTSNLPYTTTYPWGGTARNYGAYSDNINSFEIDSYFDSIKDRMLILNPNSDDFNLYYRLTIKNTGYCDETNVAIVENYAKESIRNYGTNSWNDVLSHSANPTSSQSYSGISTGALKSRTYQISANNIEHYGRTAIRIGPGDNSRKYQRVNAYFWVNGTEYEACVDNNIIDKVVFSLGDSSYSKEYDGNSGIIQRITRNQTSEEYSLWQTPNLNYTTSYPWGVTARNYGVYSGNINPFNIDSNFDLNQNKILILNQNEFDFNLYYRITLRNTGTCHNENKAWIGNYGSESIRNYGELNWNTVHETSASPSNRQEYSNYGINQTKTRSYSLSASNIEKAGTVAVRIGPEDLRDSNPEYQKVNAYFFVEDVPTFCGNGIREPGEVCDNGIGFNGQPGNSCSLTCTLAPVVTPEIKWENYETSSTFWRGDLEPGDQVNLTYSVYNPNTIDMDIQFDSVLYDRPFTQLEPDFNYRWYDIVNSRRNDVNQQRIIKTIPAGERIYFNRTVTMPMYSENVQKVIYRISYYERFKYKKSSESSFKVPKYSNGNYNYEWWLSDDMKPYSTPIWGTHTYYMSGTWSGGDWHRRDWNFARYNQVYSIFGLKPQNGEMRITVSDDGIPEIEIYYREGIVQAGYTPIIENNTFKLQSSLRLHTNNNIIESKDIFIEKTFSRTDNNNIRPYPDNRNELKINQKISFPIADFNLNNQKVYFNVVPYVNTTGLKIASTSNIHRSNSLTIKLEEPIALSVDSPITIRPKGSESFDNLYQRYLLFNHLDFAIFNPEISIRFYDSGDTDVSDQYDYDYTYPQLIPAGAAFPIGINAIYTGPTNIPTISNHQIRICLNYYDPIKDQMIDEWREDNGKLPLCERTGVIVSMNSINIPFVDLIPRDLNYTLLNLNNESIVNVFITNQGTLDANSFPVDLYVRGISNSTFKHIGTKTISSLDASESKSISFAFTPNSAEQFVIKAVVNEDKSVIENDIYVQGAHKNNVLTSIAMVRNLDVFLENVIIDYENAFNGIIPIKAYASNKGFGGIDSYEMRLTLENSNNTYVRSEFFTQIPQTGKEVIYYLNISEMESGSYRFTIDLIAPFDPDLSDNSFKSAIDFCPQPWYNGPLSCNTYCTSTCLNPFTNRYLATCHEINGCFFKDPQFAAACDGYKENSYAPLFDENGVLNLTHEAQCHQGIKVVKKSITDEDLDINGECSEIIIKKIPGIFNNLDILVNIVECVNE